MQETESKSKTKTNLTVSIVDEEQTHGRGNTVDDSSRHSTLLSPFTKSFRQGLGEPNVGVAESLDNPTNELDHFRFSLGIYREFALAQALIRGEDERDAALRESGKKQINHVNSTHGWLRSMMTLETRAFDVIERSFAIIMFNTVLCTILHEVVGVSFHDRLLQQFDTVYSLVLKTSLAFLLVFRLNRVAIRYWEARGLWGNITKHSRALVSGILLHCSEGRQHRDDAIRWTGGFAVAVIHFIRNDKSFPYQELSGYLSKVETQKMMDSNHCALYAANRIKHALKRALPVTVDTPLPVAHARTVQLNLLEGEVNNLIYQVSGMEKVRSTPLPIVYVAHLRTFLFLYLICLPYIWVVQWHWGTIPLMAFTAFALMGIEGAATECEVPFRKDRANHLAMEAYTMILLNNIQGLVVQAANLDLEEQQGDD